MTMVTMETVSLDHLRLIQKTTRRINSIITGDRYHMMSHDPPYLLLLQHQVAYATSQITSNTVTRESKLVVKWSHDPCFPL